MRIGQGYDIHALVPGRTLVLGGVRIQHTHGLLGHSDGDALFHAVADAMLGAAGMGDIGRMFPDTDPSLRGIDSAKILSGVVARVRDANWEPVNVDSSILAQRPRLSPHIEAMRRTLAGVVGIDAGAVNVKARTGELLGPVGRGEAIEVHAVVLLAPGMRDY
ncbi:MAG: 2-C-methyl-D-erythritol 2,4-cyclodiphosphate synthase [Burkholderiaceae bacterium]|nr:2-C-methyl-D-erythritol 2,4-cyclodiphosphate synthase [Burkholderiaceae bacterium]